MAVSIHAHPGKLRHGDSGKVFAGKNSFDYNIDRISSITSAEYKLCILDQMLPTGKVFSLSRKKLDDTHYRQLVELEQNRREEYKQLASVLSFVMENKWGNRLYGNIYQKLLSELVEIDAEIATTLYEIALVPHLTKDFLDLQLNIAGLASEQNLHLSEINDLNALNRQLFTLQGHRTATLSKLQSCGAISAYEYEEGLL